MRSPSPEIAGNPLSLQKHKGYACETHQKAQDLPAGDAVSGNEKMGQKKHEKGLEIYNQGCAGHVRFVDPQIKQGHLHGEEGCYD